MKTWGKPEYFLTPLAPSMLSHLVRCSSFYCFEQHFYHDFFDTQSIQKRGWSRIWILWWGQQQQLELWRSCQKTKAVCQVLLWHVMACHIKTKNVTQFVTCLCIFFFFMNYWAFFSSKQSSLMITMTCTISTSFFLFSYRSKEISENQD